MTIVQMAKAEFANDIIENGYDGMTINAFRDPSCLDRAKYIYRFSSAIRQSIVQSFVDCDMRTVRFSKIVSGAKDLVKISKDGEFQADIVIEGFNTTVYFMVTDEATTNRALELFDRRLHAVGYRHVAHSTVQMSHCDRCPVSHLKKCLT